VRITRGRFREKERKRVEPRPPAECIGGLAKVSLRVSNLKDESPEDAPATDPKAP
jgi:hypothetical protein